MSWEVHLNPETWSPTTTAHITPGVRSSRTTPSRTTYYQVSKRSTEHMVDLSIVPVSSPKPKHLQNPSSSSNMQCCSSLRKPLATGSSHITDKQERTIKSTCRNDPENNFDLHDGIQHHLVSGLESFMIKSVVIPELLNGSGT